MHTNPALLFLLARERSQELDRTTRQAHQRTPRARRRRSGRPPGE